MRCRLGVWALVLLLAGCGSAPPVPDWQMNAKGAMERAQEAYLSGNARVEAAEFARASAEVARTGRPDLLARLELARCATRVASLVFAPCSAFDLLQADAAAPERAYAVYLAGQARAADVALLPEQHRGLAAAGGPVTATSLQAVEDPLARLVAAGVLLQTGRAGPAVIAVALDTASAQGWRRPLLAWLGIQAQRAELAGDNTEAARIRRRMALVTDVR
ncbi:MAG: hypothetical protein KA164_20525 [Rhodoferax sp.]|jgi:hypothetical protein|nr:hypothetical protein [Rhodoferax sp.]